MLLYFYFLLVKLNVLFDAVTVLAASFRSVRYDVERFVDYESFEAIRIRFAPDNFDDVAIYRLDEAVVVSRIENGYKNLNNRDTACDIARHWTSAGELIQVSVYSALSDYRLQ